MSEQKILIHNFPYQVINGVVFDLNVPCRQLWPDEFLIKKPLVPVLVYLTSEGVNITNNIFWCRRAIELGDFEALQWLRVAGAQWEEDVCFYAAKNGHLDILRWARAAGAPWDEDTCYSAAQNGYFDVLKWAYLNGCPYKEIHEKEVQQKLLTDKDITWSLQCRDIWSNDNRKSFFSMIDQVVNECNKVTYSMLPACLSNLIITYL